MSVRKYPAFNRNERQITTGSPAQQFVALNFDADDDCTLVGVFVEIALAAHGNIGSVVAVNSQAAGYARLVIQRSGNTIPLVQPSQQWYQSDPPVTDSLLDADTDDTWAITPFALGSSGSGTGQPEASSVTRLILAPKTKRKLRRGDNLQLEIQYSNGGTANCVVDESVTGTLFVEG